MFIVESCSLSAFLLKILFSFLLILDFLEAFFEHFPPGLYLLLFFSHFSGFLKGREVHIFPDMASVTPFIGSFISRHENI